MGQALLLILFFLVAWQLRQIQRPFILQIIKKGNLGLIAGVPQVVQLGQIASYLSDFLEDARLGLPHMSNDRPMKFFFTAATLPPLKILHTVGTVSDGL